LRADLNGASGLEQIQAQEGLGRRGADGQQAVIPEQQKCLAAEVGNQARLRSAPTPPPR